MKRGWQYVEGGEINIVIGFFGRFFFSFYFCGTRGSRGVVDTTSTTTIRVKNDILLKCLLAKNTNDVFGDFDNPPPLLFLTLSLLRGSRTWAELRCTSPPS